MEGANAMPDADVARGDAEMAAHIRAALDDASTLYEAYLATTALIGVLPQATGREFFTPVPATPTLTFL